MKITKTQLQKIIEEEIKNVFLEQTAIIPDSESPHETIPLAQARYATGPSEEDMAYLQNLAQLEDQPGVDPGAASTVTAAQYGIDPVYDPKYIPPYKHKPYLKGKEEEYVHLAPMYTQEMDVYAPEIMDEYVDEAIAIRGPSKEIQSLQNNLRDAQLARDKYREFLDPAGAQRAETAIEVFKNEIAAQKIFEREAERAKLMADWDLDPDWESPDVASYGGPLQFDIVNTPGGRQKFYGTPHMKEYLEKLKKIGSGKWYIGDISKKGGGNIAHHGSHETGIDVDIALPALGGGMSVEDMPGGGTKLRRLSTNELDYDAALDFLRKTAPYAKSVFLDKKFEPGLKAKAKALIQSGEMSKTEYIRLFAMLGHEKHHADHFHVRLRGVYPEERGLGQRGMGRQPVTPLPGKPPERMPPRAPPP